jgi:hypothetical protein
MLNPSKRLAILAAPLMLTLVATMSGCGELVSGANLKRQRWRVGECVRLFAKSSQGGRRRGRGCPVHFRSEELRFQTACDDCSSRANPPDPQQRWSRPQHAYERSENVPNQFHRNT